MKDLLIKYAAATSSGVPSKLPNKVNENAAGDLTSTVIAVINGVIGVLGLVAVVVVIIGGVNYMTSAGDAGKVKKAKDTILYGLIGLVVCILAFAIVNFVITNMFSNA